MRNLLVSRVGFEPTTFGLKGRCSATELPAQRFFIIPALLAGARKHAYAPLGP